MSDDPGREIPEELKQLLSSLLSSDGKPPMDEILEFFVAKATEEGACAIEGELVLRIKFKSNEGNDEASEVRTCLPSYIHYPLLRSLFERAQQPQNGIGEIRLRDNGSWTVVLPGK